MELIENLKTDKELITTKYERSSETPAKERPDQNRTEHNWTLLYLTRPGQNRTDCSRQEQNRTDCTRLEQIVPD